MLFLESITIKMYDEYGDCPGEKKRKLAVNGFENMGGNGACAH